MEDTKDLQQCLAGRRKMGVLLPRREPFPSTCGHRPVTPLALLAQKDYIQQAYA